MNMQKRLRFMNEALLVNQTMPDNTDSLPKRYLDKIHKLGIVLLFSPIIQTSYFDPFLMPSIERLGINLDSILDWNAIEKIDTALSDIEPDLVVDFSEIRTHSELFDLINEINCHIAACSEACSTTE